LKIKALLKLPKKNARDDTYINQRLAIATALVADEETKSVNVALHQKLCA
jgi:hypothetical protein